MSKFGSFVAGLLTGAAIGSVLGLLYAPNDGKHTRDKLTYQLSRLQDMLKELLESKETIVSEAKSIGEANITKTQREAEKLRAEMEKVQKQIKETKKNS
jgi:gas vesicle protein